MTGQYTGNGTAQTVTLGWKPDLVLVKASGRGLMYRGRFGWHDRSNYLVNDDSILGVTLAADGFSVNSFAGLNASGETFHWVAIQDNGSGMLQQTAWIGNALDYRTIGGFRASPLLMFVKRDSTLTPALRHTGMAADKSLKVTGGTPAGWIRSFTESGFVVSFLSEVNQNNNAQMGEGIEALAFVQHDTTALTHWTGDGAASREIVAGFAPCMVMLIRNDGLAPLPDIKTDTMAANATVPFAASATVTTRTSGFTADGIALAGTDWNATGVSYSALFLRRSETAVDDLAPVPSGNYVELSGAASGIEFGTNALLDVGGGPFSLEWYGRRLTSGALVPLWIRGNTTDSGTLAANAGEASWGIYSYPPVDPQGHGWLGDSIRVIHKNYMSALLNETSVNYYDWNTGIVMPTDDVHIILTHNGAGKWLLYLNGVLAKQREIDMTAPTYGTRTNGGAGVHQAGIGVRYDAAGTKADSQAMRLYLARIYNVELTQAQVRARYRRAVLGRNATDVAPLEEWACTDGAGSILTATNNATNNATITGGTWGVR